MPHTMNGNCTHVYLRVSTSLIARRNGQPSQSHCDRTGWPCVMLFCHRLPDLGTLNNRVLLTVAFVRLWHLLDGIYL